MLTKKMRQHCHYDSKLLSLIGSLTFETKSPDLKKQIENLLSYVKKDYGPIYFNAYKDVYQGMLEVSYRINSDRNIYI